MTAARGFTLIEMVVVLLIIGLALSITAGFVARPNTGAALANASARVAAELRLARMRAMAESRPVRFVLSADGHGVRLDDAAVALSPSATLSMAGPDSITFAPDGSTTGGAVVVRVGNRKRLVQVDWLTGRVGFSAP